MSSPMSVSRMTGTGVAGCLSAAQADRELSVKLSQSSPRQTPIQRKDEIAAEKSQGEEVIMHGSMQKASSLSTDTGVWWCPDMAERGAWLRECLKPAGSRRAILCAPVAKLGHSPELFALQEQPST